MQEQIEKIMQSLSTYDWFCGVESDQSNRLVVYVQRMSGLVLSKIPDFVDNIQLLVHFDKSRAIFKNPLLSKEDKNDYNELCDQLELIES